MTARPIIRRYWREAALVTVILLPWLALLPLGFLWLWQNSVANWWFLGAAILGVAAFALRLSIAKTSKIEAEAMAERASPASPEWGLREKEAWRLVERIGRETEPLSFTEAEAITKVLERTVDAVADSIDWKPQRGLPRRGYEAACGASRWLSIPPRPRGIDDPANRRPNRL